MTFKELLDYDAGMTRPALSLVAGPAVDQDRKLDLVFFALSDGVRRAILQRVSEAPLTVSELARPFDMSLQAVSQHIQTLVRAGLVTQERSGRISRCHLDAGPIFEAAVWINRYSKYWQAQFDTLKGWIEEIDGRKAKRPKGKPKSGGKP